MHRPRSRPLTSILLALLAAAQCGCATEPPAPAVITAGDYAYANTLLDWLVEHTLLNGRVPGCAVAVATADKIVFQKTYGVREAGTNQPVTAATLFRAGSITKTLTALAVMHLAEQGRIDIDRPFADYVPDFRIKSDFKNAPPITVRMLLSHRSGLFSDYLGGIMGEKRLTQKELLDALGNQYLCFPPGRVFQYSNTGYGLLGILIERVTGVSYAEYMEREIFTPLGMTHSLLTEPPADAADLAAGHMPDPKTVVDGSDSQESPVPFLQIRDLPAGALLTDITDLTRYLQFLLADKQHGKSGIVSQRTFSEMQRVQFPESDSAFLATDYGLGLMRHVIRYQGVNDVVGHSGNVNGFYALLAWSPSLGIGIVLLTNSAAGYLPGYTVVSRALRAYGEARTGSRIPPTLPVPATPVTPDPAAYAELSGRYAVLGLTLEVRLRGDSLYVVQPELNRELMLSPCGNDRFTPVFMALGLFPVDIASFAGFDALTVSFQRREGQVRSLTVEAVPGEAVIRLVFVRENAAAMTGNGPEEALQTHLGRYRIVAGSRDREAIGLYFPTEEFELKVTDGRLFLGTVGLATNIGIYLVPVAADRALLAGTHESVLFTDRGIELLGLKAERR
ncbi:MAG TPA: class A beta-lactamase-related serine hydrolase [Spirochaetia bacterium]|nr:class A beta-lactamase-related serine hydrolase [Spirochaetia bacterium]